MNSRQNSQEKLSTEELIETVLDKQLDDERRYVALSHLILEYREELLKICEFICKSHGHDFTTAEDLTNEVFEKFFEKAEKFDVKRDSKLTVEELFMLYLNKMARNALVDRHRAWKRKEASPYDGTETIQRHLPKMSAEQIEDAPYQVRILYDVVQSFSKSHQAIFLTYRLYKKEGFTLPRKLLKSLREECCLKQNTVNRYLKEVNDAIDIAEKSYEKGKRDLY